MVTIADVFEPDGLLRERLPGFSYREAQRQMAESVWEAAVEGRHAALEAGTGIGKTYAYLIPLMLSGRSAIVSTGTKTLQDQIFERDLPALGALLGRPVDIALLKGRGNYLCWHRLETARADGGTVRGFADTLNALSDWGARSSSGDLSALDDFGEDFRLRALVTSTVDNCLGGDCEQFERCFVQAARRKAQAAQIVIVNHHLLLADLALKESGFGELLPGADTVVVDEAHQFPEAAQQFFGLAVGSRELEALVRDVDAEAKIAGLKQQIADAAGPLGRSIAEARAAVGPRSGRLAWLAGPSKLLDALPVLEHDLRALAGALAAIDDAGQGLKRCRERAEAAARKLELIVADEAPDGLRWLELSDRAFGAHWTPADIGGAMAERIDDQGGTWIFASATLAVGDDFSHFLGRVGLQAASTRVLPSPFDYRNNAGLYLPEGLPEPREPGYTAALMANVWPLLEAIGGGAFFLFTSYRALNEAVDWLQSRRLPGPLLVQGHGARSRLLEQFREDGNAVLLGTASFWQGVDVRGPALRMVVIDKLPFASPGDPLIQARGEAIKNAGGDPFVEFQLPQAVLTLKQGIGRLLRDFDDRGLIAIGDPRLRGKSYGRVFLEALPAMKPLESLDDALKFASALNVMAGGGE